MTKLSEDDLLEAIQELRPNEDGSVSMEAINEHLERMVESGYMEQVGVGPDGEPRYTMTEEGKDAVVRMLNKTLGRQTGSAIDVGIARAPDDRPVVTVIVSQELEHTSFALADPDDVDGLAQGLLRAAGELREIRAREGRHGDI